MNRFFSKLDLRDIKIDPQGTRFPPDADEVELGEEPRPIAESAAEPAEGTWFATSNQVDDGQAQSPVAEGDGEADAAEERPGASAAEFVTETATRNGEVLKVSARSRPSAVAGAIAGVVRELGRAEVQAIGAGATNQAVKAVAIARDYLRETGIEAICLPAFIDVTIDNEDRTAIRLIVEPR